MRGTAAGEPVVSQARTKEFEEGYDRLFGPEHKAQRGKWIWDEAQQKLVRAEDYRPPERALDAPILAGRFYENTAATDGTDIGSRRKHREYMKAHNLTTYDDFAKSFTRKQEERKRNQEARKVPDPTRREAIARALYQMDKP